uniref:Integrase catalytic domain-containing protein n=1 Tax=Geospiza parvula TaxID=87175 RepID=A0A8U8B5U5_GEOPR
MEPRAGRISEIPYGRVLYIDGSFQIVMGKGASGYTIIEAGEIKEKGKLPSNWSAQNCEMYALKRGLGLLADNIGTIYTDSQYAFGIAHTFGKIWQERGYLNSKVKIWCLKGTQGIYDHLLKYYMGLGIYEIARSITGESLTCQKVNTNVMQKNTPGQRKLAIRPFQSTQVDFTELTPAQGYIIVDHLMHWVEAFPMRRETAQTVTKVLLEEITPRYGLVNINDSDHGPHFTTSVLQQVIRALGIKWELHTPWHPQSSGRVERVNQTLKNILTKLVLETQQNWVKCLPLALLQIRTRPRTDLGVSPYEMLFGQPFLLTPYSIGEHLEGGTTMQKYIETVTATLEELRKKGYLPQTSPLNCKIHEGQIYGKNLFIDMVEKITKEFNLTDSWGGTHLSEIWPWDGISLGSLDILKWITSRQSMVAPKRREGEWKLNQQ